MSVLSLVPPPHEPRRNPAGRRAVSPLGQFLRARRERLGLSAAGLSTRIQSIRVMTVSSGHIYRVEKGTRMPTPETLDLIADGLGLSPDERAYVMSLIPGRPVPAPVTVGQPVPPSVHRVLEYLNPASAYVVDRKLDILAWNTATCDIYGFEISDMPVERRAECNVAWAMFHGEFLARHLEDWETHAKRIVAQCVNRWAGRHRDPEIRDILDRMLTNTQFKTWWNEPKVALRAAVTKQIRHPDVGILLLEQTVFPVADNPDLDMIVTMPLTADTQANLEKLARLDSGNGHPRQQGEADGPESDRI